MFKYEYNQDKRSVFLSFWQIEKIDYYSEKIKNFFTYFTYFAKLSRIHQQALVDIIFYCEEKKFLQIKDGALKLTEDNQIGIPIKDWSITPSDATYLDDVNFISIIKDRSFLNEERDIACLTEEAIDFFKKVYFFNPVGSNSSHIPTTISSKSMSLSRLSEPLNELAKNYLIFLASDLAKNNMSEKMKEKLCKMPEVILSISPQKIAALHLHLNEEEGIKNLDGEVNSKGDERLAYLIHCMDIYLNDQEKFIQTLDEKHFLVEKKRLKQLVQKLKLLKVGRRFYKLSFWRKANILFRLVLGKHLKVIEGLLLQFDEEKVYHPVIFFRLLNKFKIENKSSISGQSFSSNTLENLVEKLTFLGLLEVGDEGYRINNRAIGKLYALLPTEKKNNEEVLEKYLERDDLEDKMLIDTDMGVTVYRMNLVPEVFYFLLSMGELSMDEHIVTVSWDHDRSTFCETIGMGPKKMEDLLKLAAPASWSDAVSHHLKSYFYSSNGVQMGRGYLLKMLSKNKLEKISYNLKESNIPFIKLDEIEGQQTIFFNTKKDYLNGKKVLKEKDKTICFF